MLHPEQQGADSPHAPEAPLLSAEELAALKQACAPVGLLNFPSVAVIRRLRQLGYVAIVLGGVQITPLGLERLLQERSKDAFAMSGAQGSPSR